MRMMDATVIADYTIEWSHAAELKGYCESERERVQYMRMDTLEEEAIGVGIVDDEKR